MGRSPAAVQFAAGLGKQVECLADQPQFARPEDAGVAGQHLFYQGRSRARQTHHEDRPPGGKAEPLNSCEVVGGERRDEPVHEGLVSARIVDPASRLRSTCCSDIGHAAKLSGVVELAAGVADLGQPELEREAISRGENRIGEQSFDCGPVRVGQSLPKAGRQPCQCAGVPGIIPQCFAELAFALVEVSEFLEQAGQCGVW